jgi:hypothetical protein
MLYALRLISRPEIITVAYHSPFVKRQEVHPNACATNGKPPCAFRYRTLCSL